MEKQKTKKRDSCSKEIRQGEERQRQKSLSAPKRE
jgi:hypothetical protein